MQLKSIINPNNAGVTSYLNKLVDFHYYCALASACITTPVWLGWRSGDRQLAGAEIEENVKVK
jgi:hypothetical protein